MFSGTRFKHDLLTKYHAAFGRMFADITIERTSANNSIDQVIKIPLHWGSKEKMILRTEVLPEADRQYSIQLPAISYEFVQPVYHTDRKGISVVRNVRVLDQGDPERPSKFKVQYNPIPFDLYYNVYVYAKNIPDANQIIEQILAFFSPDFTITMNLIPEMEEIRDIPVVLKNATYEDLGQVDKPYERRILVWTLQFVAHAWLFGPVKRKHMIKDIITNFRLDARVVTEEAKEFPPMPDITDEDAPIAAITEEYPGLTANGEPTHDISNAIDWRLVEVDDNYGVVVQKVNITAGSNT